MKTNPNQPVLENTVATASVRAHALGSRSVPVPVKLSDSQETVWAQEQS